jgi:outer membrane protein OmpA-like peptidoglycan-associated protein
MNKDQKLIAEAYQQIQEQYYGSNKAPVTVSQDGKTINLNSDVLFDFDSGNIRPDGQQVISNIAAKIKEIAPQLQTRHQMSIIGNTDLYELKPGYNQKLSNDRAQNVAAAINNVLGNSTGNLSVISKGVGSGSPVVKDLPYPIEGNKAPEQGRAQQAPNRRVTITFNPPLPRPIQQQLVQDVPKMSIQSTPNQQGTYKMGDSPKNAYRGKIDGGEVHPGAKAARNDPAAEKAYQKWKQQNEPQGGSIIW